MPPLLETDQNMLLQIVRTSVSSHLSGDARFLPKIPNGALTQASALFVSIHKSGELRGCVGSLQSLRPLYLTAADCAVSAATGDPRFVPLVASELSQVTFEVSVLSPLERIESIDQIQIGLHGLFVEKDQSRGLLLPQVATHYGWDRARFLAETCRKAGLRSHEHDAVNIHRFTAQVFSEETIHAA